MLHKELKDSDIPHHTTIHDRVEEILMEHFDKLEEEMHVRYFYSPISDPGCSVTSQVADRPPAMTMYGG